jgi:hypothetical protein
MLAHARAFGLDPLYPDLMFPEGWAEYNRPPVAILFFVRVVGPVLVGDSAAVVEQRRLCHPYAYSCHILASTVVPQDVAAAFSSPGAGRSCKSSGCV